MQQLQPATGIVLLASPRGWCAGVDRAVEIVERALERHGPPVYVRKQIVHNLHVVRGLERRGAIFVDSEDEVPEGAVCVLSAHGVSPAVRANAAARRLDVIDATCPLVAKVHVEARRFAIAGRRIFLIGHASHEEVQGTSGEAPAQTLVIERPEDLDAAGVRETEPVAYLTQTTLAVDDTAEVVAALRRRFPDLAGPHRDDICYASQNRQQAVKAIAGRSDVVLIVGSANSSNANRLVEVAEHSGARARLVENAAAADDAWLGGARTVGVSSGASTPEILVDELLAWLGDRGFPEVQEVRVATEDVRFPLPERG
ncbi:MAG TPA: 4-hydroxy-3-methylbut-2-enyl diphosphate reductase [Actinomycetota bacterium]|nr:4-hydroxy-3-methylbut-2-enyl diphosphate reductase [Actinomycetota bacterium]